MLNGIITFEKVTLNIIEQRLILKNVNLNITGGEMTLFVGHSGAGKSTMLNLIPRFYDFSDGDIKIDNQSIKSKRLSSLRENISLVSQETTLFDDTILNNIKYANQMRLSKISGRQQNYLFPKNSRFIPNKYYTK